VCVAAQGWTTLADRRLLTPPEVADRLQLTTDCVTRSFAATRSPACASGGTRASGPRRSPAGLRSPTSGGRVRSRARQRGTTARPDPTPNARAAARRTSGVAPSGQPRSGSTCDARIRALGRVPAAQRIARLSGSPILGARWGQWTPVVRDE
jgi:hypothetical protein